MSLCRTGTEQRRGIEHREVWLTGDDRTADVAFVLADTADAVEPLRREHGTVFVHCVRCESRTPPVVIGCLTRHRRLSFDDALHEVRGDIPA